MEDSNEYSYEEDEYEIDEEYEFNASQFYDFTRSEFDFEIEEAEHWFEVSGDYPPSPFIIKLNLEKVLYDEIAEPNSSTANQDVEGRSHYHQTLEEEDGSNPNTKPNDKPKRNGSTLMKPTACHLAKQRTTHQHDINNNNISGHLCTDRFQTTSKLHAKNRSSKAGVDKLETKRKKLEAQDYLKMIVQLKHRFTLQHKSSKKATVPKEPDLQTLIRAESKRSKSSSLSSRIEKQEQKGRIIAAHLLKQKDDSIPIPPQPKKSAPQLGKFKMFRLKSTVDRVNRHASAKVYPSGGEHTDVTQLAKHKPTSLKLEPELPTIGQFLERPLANQFTKVQQDFI